MLTAALTSDDYPRREDALVSAYEEVALRHNAAQISDPEDPAARLFHDRPFRVIDARRFARVCVQAIDDPLFGSSRSWEQSTSGLTRLMY